jgi:hypothetical protein
LNCSTAWRSCSYPDKNASPAASTPPPHPASHSTASPEALVIIGQTLDDFPIQQAEEQLSVNMHHLELLHHFSTETFKSSGMDELKAQISCQMIVKSGLSTPYLMHEILAFASLHLSILRPGQREFYAHQAAQLQTHAVSLFNRTKADITADNCIPMFFFSSILGVHVLCETLAFRDDDFNAFLDRFINYIHLHRGVRAVAGQSWELLLQTELRPILEDGQRLPPIREGVRQECSELQTLIKFADLDPSSIKACQQAIVYLQGGIHAQRTLPGTEGGANMVYAWPVLVPAEYVDLLVQRRPEALIILAYYAVILHYHRELWAVGEAGRFLIQSVTTQLGTHWEKWLAWPNDVLIMASQPATQSSIN